MKRLLVCALAAIMTASLVTGCGNTPAKGPEAPTTEGSGAVEAEKPTDTEPAPDAAKAVNITHWEMMSGAADTYPGAAQKIVDQFNESNGQNITVKLQMTPWDNFYQTFLTAVTSGAAPDTSTGAFPQPVQYGVMGEMLDLSPIVTQWEEEGSTIPSELPKGSLEMLTYEGILTGIPWATDPRGISYRKDVFEKAGITKLPTTWEEFLEVCKAIKEKTDTVPFVFGGGDGMSNQTMMFFLIQNGVGMTNEKVEAEFTSKNVLETLEFLNKIYSNGYISEGTASYKGADAEKMYCSGTAAMWFNGMPAALKDYKDIDENTSVLPPMAGPSGKAQNYVWINSIMGYQQTDSPDAARAFIKHWIENEKVLWLEGNCNQLPAVSSLVEDPYFQDTWYMKEFSEVVVPNSVPPSWPATSLYPAFSQIEGENYLGIALQEVITGNTDYQTVAQEANESIAKALEDYAN